MAEIIQYNGQDIMAEFDTMYAEGYRAIGQLYPKMARSLRYYLGDQWEMKERQAMEEEGRSTFTVNKIMPMINWIDGYQIQNQNSSIVTPRYDASQQAADDMTSALLYVFSECDGYKYIQENFSASNKCGWSLLNVYFDYNTDPLNGDFRFGRSPYSAIMPDPYISRLDLDEDCNWLIQRKYISPVSCVALLPNQEKQVLSLARDGWERDNKFTWMVFQRVPTGQRMMAYNEFWRRKYKDQRVLVNRMTKQFTDWTGSPDDLSEIMDRAASMGHEIVLSSRKKKYVEKHIILNNNYMRTEIDPYGLNEYPFALDVAIFESESENYNDKFQSLIQQQIDPQKERNRRRSQMIDVVESQLNSGWIEEDGAVKNPKMLYFSGQGKRIVLNKGKTVEAIRRIDGANIPPSFFQEVDLSDRDMMDIIGLNQTVMGQSQEKQVSAIVELQRQAQALTGQQSRFSKLREFQKILSRKVLKMLQTWSPEKVAKVIGRMPDPQFYDPDLTKYQVVVQEGALTDTQRFMQFRQAVELKQMDEPVPPGWLTKMAPLQGKNEFLKAVEEYGNQQKQLQQQINQREMETSQALTQAAQAKAVADLAKSKRDEGQAISFLGLDAEREARAQLDSAQAVYERIRAAKELAAMDDESLHKYVQIIMDMENIQQARAQAKEAEDTASVKGSA